MNNESGEKFTGSGLEPIKLPGQADQAFFTVNNFQ